MITWLPFLGRGGCSHLSITHTHTHTYIYISCHAASTDFTDSGHSSQSSIASSRSSRLHPVVDKFLLVGQHLHVRVKGSIGERHISPSLFLEQCLVCFVGLIYMVLEMGGRWPYSCCFVGCCFQDLFNITRSILVQFPYSFFSIRLVNIHVRHPYSRIDTTVAWKKLHFILSD